jgi:hypothetical protein
LKSIATTETFSRYILLYSSVTGGASRYDLVDLDEANGNIFNYLYFSSTDFDLSYGSLSLMHRECFYLFLYYKAVIKPGIAFYWYDINLGTPVTTTGFMLYRITGTAYMRLEMAQ